MKVSKTKVFKNSHYETLSSEAISTNYDLKVVKVKFFT